MTEVTGDNASLKDETLLAITKLHAGVKQSERSIANSFCWLTPNQLLGILRHVNAATEILENPHDYPQEDPNELAAST
uniref:Uncharacterized protein n=1 Tax=viral metagenome TaxID=1070528 RepID=A0A6M3IH97_9ZZZZ